LTQGRLDIRMKVITDMLARRKGYNTMSDEKTQEQAGGTQQGPGDAWKEVGKQFETLGESLAAAFRKTWADNEQVQGHVQAGLEAMLQEINLAIKEAAASSDGQKVQGELKKAAQSARQAGEQAWREGQPHLTNALRQILAELQKAIDRIEQEQATHTAGKSDSDEDDAV